MNVLTETRAVRVGPLNGDLSLPARARGVVLFAHGSGSGRHSSRNRYVAEALQHAGLATLLIDLLTEQEEEIDVRTASLRFDIPMLAERVVESSRWLSDHRETAELAIGCFGASTGGGAALVAAARVPSLIQAVVSRGGRPDLAGDALRDVQAPTLLIVGEYDATVIELNRRAFAQMTAPRRLDIVPGASHLFEERGALEKVAYLASEWFTEHLGKR